MTRDKKPHKSTHLQTLENAFEARTRRFSPFEVLGIHADTKDIEKVKSAAEEETYIPMSVHDTHRDVYNTHMSVDEASVGESVTHPHVSQIHTKEVVDLNTSTQNKNAQTAMSVHDTHRGVYETPPCVYRHVVPPTAIELPIPEVLLATQLRTQLGQKARQVLAALNNLRSLERPAYTVPVGYGQLSATADCHAHYLRRHVLPKLTMLGVVAIAQKTFDGTIYHLQHSTTFLRLVAGEEDVSSMTLPLELEPEDHPGAEQDKLPPWIDSEYWGWLAPDSVEQLVAKAGSETQAREILAIILYNETHGTLEQRVRNRRSVLAHYLRHPQAEIWPNDGGYETLALRQARQQRDQALQEKALAEEALRARQEAAQARFAASLTTSQLRWLKQQAKARVDVRPEAKMLQSRYPLYKAEEEDLLREWLDRVAYGETVPHAATAGAEQSDGAET